jgi:outer membrane protein
MEDVFMDAFTYRNSLCLTATILSLTFGMASGSANGEPPRLTLQEAIATALEHHPRLAQARQRMLEAQAHTDQATSILFPQVRGVLNSTTGSARSNTSLNSGAIIENPNSNQVTVGAIVDQLIYDFGRTSHRIRANTLTAESREHDLRADRGFTILKVEEAYYAALNQSQLVNIAEHTVRERSLILKLITILSQRGKRSKIDASLAEVEVKNAQFLELQARADLKVALHQLQNTMGLEGMGHYALEGPGPSTENFPSLDQLQEEAKRHRPELEAVRMRLESSQVATISAQRQKLPTLNAIASTGQSAISDKNGKWWYGAFGVVSLPLFTGGRIESEIREAQAIQRNTQARLRELVQKVELQVASAYHTQEALTQKVDVAQEQVAIARIALGLARERLRLGLGSIVELTQAEVAVTQAETTLTVSRNGVLTALAALDYATGTGIRQFTGEK